MANEIVIKKRAPVRMAPYLGLRVQSNSSIPAGVISSFYGCYSSTEFNSPHTIQIFPNKLNTNPSPINYNLSGKSSPNPIAPTSPMHQITKGISGLSTGGGSITRGTSAAFESASNQPLDLSMDVTPTNSNSSSDISPNNANASNLWYVPAQFYDLKPLNLSPAQPVRIATTPPASPNLCIIQEEQQPITPQPIYQSQDSHQNTNISDEGTLLHSPPQISVTDVQGSEVTLITASSSDESLETQNSMTMQGLIISEPSNDMPSITRGVGRKSSLDIENRQENYERRGSDKSLGFSDDSLSNDSNLISPSQEPSGASSGFKSGDSEITEAPLSPDSLSDSRRMSEECYELPLPHECSDLDSSRIIEIVKQTIDSKMPPKCFILHKMDSTHAMSNGSVETESDMQLNSIDISNLSLEYSGGLQIELQVYGGKCKDNCNKGIKLRRISGDQFEYGKLCQQLISSLTV